MSALIVLSCIISSCSSDESIEILSSEKEILSFIIPGVKTEIIDTKILIYIAPYNKEKLEFKPSITVSAKATISPVSESYDFTHSLNFNVIAQDGSSKKYTTQIIIENRVKSVELLYAFQTPFGATGVYKGILDNVNKVIEFKVVKELLLQDNVLLQFKATVAEGVNTEPASLDFVDMSLNKFTANIDGKDIVYNVMFTNTNNDFKSMFLELLPGQTTRNTTANYAPLAETVGLKKEDFVYYILENRDITKVNITTQKALPIGATITPSIDAPTDFSSDVNYVIKAEGGSERPITVRVIRKKLYFESEMSRVSSSITLPGSYIDYFSISKLQKLTAINKVTGQEVACSFTSHTFNPIDRNNINYRLLDPVSIGDRLFFKVELANGDVIETKCSIIIKE